MKQKIIFFTLLVVGMILLSTPLKLISYFILIFGAAALLPMYKKSGYLTRVVFYFLLITCIHQAVALIFWKFNLQYTYTWALLPLYFILAFVGVKKMTLKSPFRFACTKQEIVALMFSLACTGAIGISTLNGGSITQQSIRYLSRGFDNSTHLSMALSDYRAQGYVYGSSTATKGQIMQGYSSYPQGWHLTNSIIWHGLPIKLTTNNIAKLLLTYVLTTLMWYSILLYLTTLLIIALAQKMLRKPLSFPEYLGVLVSGIIIQAVFLTGLLASGFSNYIALLAYVITSMILLFELANKHIEDVDYILFTALLALGMSFTWILAAPIGYVMVIAPFLLKDKCDVKYIFDFIKDNKVTIFSAVSLLVLGATQSIIQVKYGMGVSQINATGGAWPLNQYLIMATSAVTLWVILSKNKLPKSINQFSQVAFISCALFVGAIYIYQYHTTATINYYSEKVTLSLLLIMMIISSSLFIFCLQNVTKKSNRFLSFFVIAGILVSLPVAFKVDTSISRYAFGYRELSEYSASQIAEILTNNDGFHNNVIVLKGLNQFEDISTTHAIDSLAKDLTPDACSLELNNALILGKNNLRIKAVSLCAELYSNRIYYVISSSKTNDLIKRELGEIRNVKIVESN